MGKFLLICIFLCTGICKTSAQIVDLSKFVKANKNKTEVFSQKLHNTRDSLLRICKIHKLEDFEYKFPTIYLGESMESLKAKSKEFNKIKVEIENAISKKELEQKSADSIQRIDGTNFTYQFRNNEGKETFSVKVSFFVNEKKNVLYTISSLQKK